MPRKTLERASFGQIFSRRRSVVGIRHHWAKWLIRNWTAGNRQLGQSNIRGTVNLRSKDRTSSPIRRSCYECYDEVSQEVLHSSHLKHVFWSKQPATFHFKFFPVFPPKASLFWPQGTLASFPFCYPTTIFLLLYLLSQVYCSESFACLLLLLEWIYIKCGCASQAGFQNQIFADRFSPACLFCS